MVALLAMPFVVVVVVGMEDPDERRVQSHLIKMFH